MPINDPRLVRPSPMAPRHGTAACCMAPCWRPRMVSTIAKHVARIELYNEYRGYGKCIFNVFSTCMNKVKSKVTHFGGGVFHFFAVFGPNGQRGTTSAENFSIERPIFVAPPPPPSPNGGTQTFYPAFRAISNLHFFSHHNIFSEI